MRQEALKITCLRQSGTSSHWRWKPVSQLLLGWSFSLQSQNPCWFDFACLGGLAPWHDQDWRDWELVVRCRAHQERMTDGVRKSCTRPTVTTVVIVAGNLTSVVSTNGILWLASMTIGQLDFAKIRLTPIGALNDKVKRVKMFVLETWWVADTMVPWSRTLA